jgi:hypothetical protein
VIVEDPALALPALPRLAEPVGSLEAPLSERLDPALDRGWVTAGRRAWVVGGAGRGAARVVMPPLALARDLRLQGAVADAAVITPLGVERWLRVGTEVVVERVVVPRTGAFALLEWHAPGDGAAVTVEWVAMPASGVATGAPARWRRGQRALMVTGAAVAVFVLSAEPEELMVSAGGAAGEVHVAARLGLPAGGSVRLVVAGGDLAGGGGEHVVRALRAADRSRSVVQGRRADAERLRSERLSLASPDPGLDRALEWAKARLAGRVTDVPAAGRALVSRRTGEPRFITAEAVNAALDCLTIGDADAARDVVGFLARQQDAAGRIPGDCGLDGTAGPGDPAATAALLLLVGQLLDRSGDVPMLRGLWPALRRAGAALVADAALEAGAAVGWSRAAGGTWAPAIQALGRVAEAVGITDPAVGAGAGVAVGTIEGSAAMGVAPVPGAAEHDPEHVLPRVRELLGVEPDASRGRLVLRPRPPAAWDRFEARGIRMGEAGFSLRYDRRGRVHRLAVRQDLGAVPVSLILEPELTGRPVAARVDGRPAALDSTVLGERSRVSVQLALDHERTLELEMGGKTGTPGG